MFRRRDDEIGEVLRAAPQVFQIENSLSEAAEETRQSHSPAPGRED